VKLTPRPSALAIALVFASGLVWAAPPSETADGSGPTASAPGLSGVCERVARAQSETLARARETVTKDKLTRLEDDPRYGPGGSLYEVAGGNWKPGGDAKEALAARLRVHASALERARRYHDARAVWVLEHSMPSEQAWVTLSTSLYPAGSCSAYARGAWSIEAHDLECHVVAGVPYRTDKAVAWNAGFSLAHYDEVGKQTEVDVGSCCGPHYDGELVLDPLVLFDFDGDGSPEAIVHSRLRSAGPVDEGTVRVKSYRNGAIVDYPSFAKVAAFGAPFDADGDGRPDFRTHAGIEVADRSPSKCRQREIPEPYAPTFLVHSLADGTFSTSDDAAKRYAKEWCPQSPPVISSLEDVGCARLWANSKEKVESEAARIAASCVDVDLATCNQSDASATPNAVYDCHLRAEAFATIPPLTLP
jgi:hypothetical protein